jgi:hypothetical protein
MCRAALVLSFLLIFAGLGVAASEPVTDQEKQALSLISFPWQDLHYEIVFMPARPGLRAMTFRKTHTIEVYVRPADDVRLLAYDIAHELGHAIDMTYNTKEIREKWMELRGIDPATPWFGCNECTDFNTPAGDFAETFALLVVGPEHFAGRIAPPPSLDQAPVLAAFFPKDSIPQD